MGLAELSCGLRVAGRIRLRRERSLPIPGEVLVAVGDAVGADQTVARALLPGRLSVIDAAARLAVAASDLPGLLEGAVGRDVAAGEVIARSRSLFGLLRSELRAPVGGRITSVSAASGQIMIEGEPAPVTVDAFLDGEIVEVAPDRGAVVEGEGALVQGVCGWGGEAAGALVPAAAGPDRPLDCSLIPDAGAAVLLAGTVASADDLAAAAAKGAAAIILGGADAVVLDAFFAAGGVASSPVLVLTGGFGRLPMATAAWDLLCGLAGRRAAVSGRTQIRAGAVRPEIVIPAAAGAAGRGVADESESGSGTAGLAPGLRVRVAREPGFGSTGSVAEVHSLPRALPSGVTARTVEVLMDDGSRREVAVRNLEAEGTVE